MDSAAGRLNFERKYGFISTRYPIQVRREVYPMEPTGDRWIEGMVMVNREGEELVREEKADGEVGWK